MAQLIERDDEPLALLVSTDEGNRIEGAVQLAIGPDARFASRGSNAGTRPQRNVR